MKIIHPESGVVLPDGLFEGAVFGRLIVLVPVYTRTKGNKGAIIVKCSCSCGNEHVATWACLRGGNTSSCGCLSSELISSRQTTHGESRTRLYGAWNGMVDRCHNPNSRSWRNYGGRGITVAPEWRQYGPFSDWAKCSGYQKGLQLDRIDNESGYSPGNCRWTTLASNLRNKRTSRLVNAFGEVKNLIDWIDDPRCVVEWSCLWCRLKRGVPPELAMTTAPWQKLKPSTLSINE